MFISLTFLVSISNRLIMTTDPNVLIYSNAINIVVEMLGTTLAWFMLMLQLLVAHPQFIPPHKGLLQLPGQKNLVQAAGPFNIFREDDGQYTLSASIVISHSWKGWYQISI